MQSKEINWQFSDFGLEIEDMVINNLLLLAEEEIGLSDYREVTLGIVSSNPNVMNPTTFTFFIRGDEIQRIWEEKKNQ